MIAKYDFNSLKVPNMFPFSHYICKLMVVWVDTFKCLLVSWYQINFLVSGTNQLVIVSATILILSCKSDLSCNMKEGLRQSCKNLQTTFMKTPQIAIFAEINKLPGQSLVNGKTCQIWLLVNFTTGSTALYPEVSIWKNLCSKETYLSDQQEKQSKPQS